MSGSAACPIPMSPLAKKVFRNIRYGTWLLALQRRLGRLGFEVMPFYIVRERRGGYQLPDLEGPSEDYRFDFLEPGEIENAPGTQTMRGNAEGFMTALREGHKCLVARHKGTIVASGWMSFGSWEFFKQRFPLKKTEAYLSTMHTVESHRGRNISPHLRHEMYKALNQMGIDTFFSVSEVFNKPSIRFKKKLNAEFLELCVGFKIGSHRPRILRLKTFKT